MVAVLYLTGRGVTTDTAEGLKRLQAMVDAGKSDGASELGSVYLKGWGVPVDYTQALAWFNKAAAAGEPDAQYELGVMNENAMGVRQDRVAAMSWYILSAAQNNEDATTAAASLKKQMSGGDLRRAQNTAKAFTAVPMKAQSAK